LLKRQPQSPFALSLSKGRTRFLVHRPEKKGGASTSSARTVFKGARLSHARLGIKGARSHQINRRHRTFGYRAIVDDTNRMTAHA